MGWLARLRRHREMARTGEPLDLDGLLDEGLRDRLSGQDAITCLNREWKALDRHQRTIDAQLKGVTPRHVRGIVRANPQSPDLGAYQLAQVMQDAPATCETLRGEQLAAVENRPLEIQPALDQLKAYARRRGKKQPLRSPEPGCS